MYALHTTGCQPRESNWRDIHQFNGQNLPNSVRLWLLDQGSLTQRLVKASRGQFHIILLNQGWQRPRPSEAQLLGMNSREYAVIREVTLMCYDLPWVFARSVLPATSLKGHLRQLRQLDNSSLGSLLFKDPSMRRSPFEVAKVDGLSAQIPETLQHRGELWGRRCRFELAHKPIMVSEIFLPHSKL